MLEYMKKIETRMSSEMGLKAAEINVSFRIYFIASFKGNELPSVVTFETSGTTFKASALRNSCIIIKHGRISINPLCQSFANLKMAFSQL